LGIGSKISGNLRISSGAQFKCNFKETKLKYYRAANGILAKVGNKDNVSVTLSLLASKALPVLTYGLEALSLNKSERTALNHPWERSFEKILNTFDAMVVKYCQQCLGYLPVSLYYCLNTLSFLGKLSRSTNLLLRMIYTKCGQDDLNVIANLLNCNSESVLINFKDKVYKHFADM
jgi:hypothetical protein